jgi:hypothetical protein
LKVRSYANSSAIAEDFECTYGLIDTYCNFDVTWRNLENQKMGNTQKLTTFLWFDGNAKEAVDYYCEVFPESQIVSENPVVIAFEIFGQKFAALNGGPQFQFT